MADTDPDPPEFHRPERRSESNPYEAPPELQRESPFRKQAAETAAVSPKAIEMLCQTRPWVRFLSILGFILAGLMVLMAIFTLIGAGLADPISGLLALLHVGTAVLYVIPSVYLHRYAGHISQLEAAQQGQQLEDALEAQKSFWRFVGILMAVVLVLYAVMLVVLFGMTVFWADFSFNGLSHGLIPPAHALPTM